jgi:CRP/FNR family transcriptional regulator, anaerobic regulatory protein
MYEKLIDTISNLIELQDDDLSIIKSLFKPHEVNKDSILIDKGEYSYMAFFINSGYLRYFKVIETGEEQTIHLLSPGQFAASFCGFVTNTKSEETLHTITDSELLVVTKNDLEKLYNTDTKWQIFGRKLMEILLLEKEKRIIDQLSLSAQARYTKLMEVNPSLIQNCPIQYIASYIGIQPESLSRIRKQIFLTNVK